LGILQVYATLLAIFFAVGVAHLQFRYGVFAVKLLIDRAKKHVFVFVVVFMIVIITSIAASTESFVRNSSLRSAFIHFSMFGAVFPLPFIVNLILSTFKFSPIDIVNYLLGKIRRNLAKDRDKYRMKKLLGEVFKLVSLTISDLGLQVEFGNLVERISSLIDETRRFYINSMNCEKSREVCYDFVLPILIYFKRYVADVVRRLPIHELLITGEELEPLLHSINNAIINCIMKNALRDDYEYFISGLEELISLYLRGSRLTDIEPIINAVLKAP